MKLEEKADALNAFIEDVENWVIARKDHILWPERWINHQMPTFKHENLIVGARVEMYGIGKVFKRVVLTSDKYVATEIPKKMRETALCALFAPKGQDVLNPRSVTKPGSNMIEYEARWVPPDDYLRKLKVRAVDKKIMTPQEWETWRAVFGKAYSKFRRKPPNYIAPEPFSAVPKGLN